MRRVVVLMGSNLEPARHLREAVAALSRVYRVASVSPTFHTRPVGDPDQPDFLNAAAVLVTDDDPVTVERTLHAIETDLGRVRDPARPCGPRTIDLDILVYNRQIVDDDVRTRSFLKESVHFLLPEVV